MKSLNQLANSRSNKFVLIAVDETEHWRDDIAKKARMIEGVYLVNLREPTHLCELSVSYYATFIKNYFHNTDAWDDDDITEMEMDNGGKEGCYFSGSSTFNVIKMYKSGTLEEAEEYERCNPTYC